MRKNAIAILSSNKNMPRNGDQYHQYRQSSDFYYLTGITQEGSLLLLCPEHPQSEMREILFLIEPTEKTRKWKGPGLAKERAKEMSGIENICWLSAFDELIDKLISETSVVYFNSLGNSELSIGYAAPDAKLRKLIKRKYPIIEERPLDPVMLRLRMIKEPEEIAVIQKACNITNSAFQSVLMDLKPGKREYEIEALIAYNFLKNGAEGPAYESIVASGENALILHYVANSGVCSEGDLLLLDFGADLGYYASDCSRTIPVNGKFNKRQLELYEANLRVLKQAISLMTVGKLMSDFHNEVGLIWEKEHIDLGLYSLADVRDQDEKDPCWRQYYWHGTSHSIGIDVHDPFDRDFPFKPGMILSCEPGLYIREEEVGLRLENDILISEEGPVDLTADIPLEPGEIEELMNR